MVPDVVVGFTSVADSREPSSSKGSNNQWRMGSPVLVDASICGSPEWGLPCADVHHFVAERVPFRAPSAVGVLVAAGRVETRIEWVPPAGGGTVVWSQQPVALENVDWALWAGELMTRCLPIAVVQAEPVPVEDALDVFAHHVAGVAADFPQAELLIYPELYLCGLNGRAEERDAHMAEVAEPLDGPRLRRLREIAGDLGRWILPGSVYERPVEGDVYNTTVLLSPQGEITASYRKMFPWRPYEE